MQAQFEKMISALETAVRNNPRYYEAVLTAYDRSLTLNPNYPEAIEYRAEAYLALNRPSDARSAYLRLKLLSPENADELLEAFSTWLEERRQNPAAGLDALELDQLAEWIRSHRSTPRLQLARRANLGSRLLQTVLDHAGN